MLDIATAGWVSLGHLPLGAHEPVSLWHGDAGNGPFCSFSSLRGSAQLLEQFCVYMYIFVHRKK